ncbi:hypothetical protein [Desulfocurvus sp.]|jgi:hypothetical protein|uniref:hypothetical protein n=1 Tax=Desulfocurvus sp. TaxID=2871698 RepID=UPI0025C73BFA|nr:hypothetical protein [Desulfocurvus sp.]
MPATPLSALRPGARAAWSAPDLDSVPCEPTEADGQRFARIVSVDLSPEQELRAVTPGQTHPKQRRVLALHWHPEFVPMPLIARRLDALFPGAEERLVIPTQHNELTSFGDYSGVEVDCYSSGFNQKIQLLLHFRTERLERAHTLRQMLRHTHKYRSSQLFEFMAAILEPRQEIVGQAAAQTGADETTVEYVRRNLMRIDALLAARWDDVPRDSLKNKLLAHWFDTLRAEHSDPFIDRVQTYLRAVKALVKARFSLDYFYRASEVIEEARALGAGIVIPHPEQFWPVLLAEYDVDGWEVWNPQSSRYTAFLVSVLHERNRCRPRSGRPLMVFMGDDTHMGEKVKDPAFRNPEKSAREIGVQPWDDMLVRKQLILASMDRARVMAEYRARLDG